MSTFTSHTQHERSRPRPGLPLRAPAQPFPANRATPLRIGLLTLLTLTAALLLAPAAARADAMGPACVESGNVLVIDGHRAYRKCEGGQPVMLYGIAAPSLDQTCTFRGKVWPCGREAASTLLRLTLNKTVSCTGDSFDREGRLIAVCHAGGVDLNAALVRLGLAVSEGTKYARQEGAARAARAGMWIGEFERPDKRSALY
ncbi:thermonuclease family protein [Roseospira marina]|uniref:Thermonuclease family protein n=1 Tax=Roseospira marina TaxID=140057 RepID=A0A5M6IIB4_9PROT|nr:thermonuclease family protein [Roseospira marina]KAA5607599.1 thermonuclease family protein [Roseospira marina]MBB4312206.1 endonuclease YncB(thermonuclease family) [Roseospira marina]MBB5085778.1 endonuclease YncB(thermonuclease family) [Roseospira marina]